jgi:solute carrier family 34 (sodium-dependent phosphate cotransporter)
VTSEPSALDRLRRHRPLPVPARGVIVVMALYAFLVGVSLLETGISAMGEGFTEGLLASVRNPVAGVFAGILFTVLVQSSSVSTSAVVGLVGAGTIPVSLAVPMMMGANIGTTVTNTLASLGSIRRTDEFRRGFAAATVHDFFNVMAVVVLLPLELLTGALTRASVWLTGLLRGTEVELEPGGSPLRDAVGVPVGWFEQLLDGDPIGGPLAGVLFLVIGLGLIFLALATITKNMRTLVADSVERAMNRLVGRGGGSVGILVGILVTFAVQSSTITTSILVPLVAAGILTLPNAYPITLGANVGTTITALLASLAVVHPEGLTIALVHTLFNITALALLFPFRPVRLFPVRAAEWLADVAVDRRSVVAVYVAGMFVVVPLAGMVVLR